ncbi:MAG: hypothetical protein ACLR55_07835 [Roseburia sp.]
MYYINENIKDLYRVKFHDNREGVLRLDMNENPDGLPEKSVSAGDGKKSHRSILQHIHRKIDLWKQLRNMMHCFMKIFL